MPRTRWCCAPFPDEVAAALTGWPGPLPIRGFVRLPEGCVPLGGLRVMSYGSGRAAGGSRPRVEECRLLIEDRLPSRVLDRVRPVPAVDLPDLGWLDLLPGDSIGALRGFVTGWFADVPAATSVAPAAPVPAALAVLYAAS